MPGSVPELISANFYPRLIRALVESRNAAGLRQQDVADRLSRPQAFVSRYETLERRLDVADYVAVAIAIGCDPLALLAQTMRQETGLG